MEARTRILLLSEENATVSFAQEVLALASATYEIQFCAPSPEMAEALLRFKPAIAVVNLDSAPFRETGTFEKLRAASPETLFFGFAAVTDKITNDVRQFLHAVLSAEDLHLNFMTQIIRLRDIYRLRLQLHSSLQRIVGHGNSVQKLYRTIEKAIPGNGTVLIQGESGVGKELVARAIASVQPKFVIVNCSAIPENLFESELFGHVRGAFTGAFTDRTGLFEEASGGAIFLDEIGDIPLPMQTKLLRTLQNGEIRPVGSSTSRQLSVRVIAATNRDLKKETASGKFRKDLYYRLNVIPISVPPLRARREDIPDLISHFIHLYASTAEESVLGDGVLDALLQYDWPGNIRELENLIHRAVSLMDGNVITLKDLFPEESSAEEIAGKPDDSGHPPWASLSYDAFKEFQRKEEREFIAEKIKENGGSVSRTADALGILRTALHNRAARIGLDLHALRKNQ